MKAFIEKTVHVCMVRGEEAGKGFFSSFPWRRVLLAAIFVYRDSLIYWFVVLY